MRSQTAQNLSNLDEKVDTIFSKTLQNISTISLNILDLRENVTSLGEDVSLEIMSLNQDSSVKLDNLNSTQVRSSFLVHGKD